MVKPRFEIKSGYIHRTENHHFDATPSTDNWQKEVYQKAKELMIEHKLQSVLDFGCGSGYKLINYLGDYDITGIEVSPTFEFLKKTYPNHKWINFNELADHKPNADLVICADVIEHVPNPNHLLKDLASIANSKFILISTPDRSLLNTKPFGPPFNRTHMREWTFDEFKNYIYKNPLFTIIEHYISNKKQATQLIILQKAN